MARGVTGGSVLILECHRQTLAAAWALKAAGFTPVLGFQPGREEDRFVTFSRVTDQYLMHGRWGDPGLADALATWLRAPGGARLILPAGEACLPVLMELRHRAPDCARQILLPSDTVIRRALAKEGYSAWGQALGLTEELGLPPTREVRGRAGIQAAGRAMGYPLALKPLNSNTHVLGRKCLFVESEAMLDALDLSAHGKRPLLAQRKAVGRRHNVMFLAQEGRVTHRFECEVLRTDVFDGTGYGVDVRGVAPHPAHTRAVEALAARFEWDGLGCAQFMFDAKTGRSQFLEINPRIDANIAAAALAGVNLVGEAARARLGRSTQPKTSYRAGRRLHWGLADLDGLREPGLTAAQRRRRARDLLRAACLAHGHAVFRWRDPLPAIYLGYRWAGGTIKSALRRVVGRARPRRQNA